MTFCLTPLENLGNTCYMNSSIQALFATPEFRDYMLFTKSNGRIHSSLSKLFNDMIKTGESEDTETFRPEEFYKEWIDFKPQFNNNRQHDSQEFLRLLIDGLHEEVNEAKGRQRPKDRPELKSSKDSFNHYIQYIDDSFLVKLFVGQLCSTIKCCECNHESQCWDTFWDLSLSLPEGDETCWVRQCLDSYMADEVLDNDSMPTCDKCKTKRKSIKSIRVERSPLILTVNLKRFGNNGTKLTKKISAEYNLYLNAMQYVLYACVCHNGFTTTGGHYDIYCGYESGNWYHFSDNTIDQIEADKVHRELFSEAYILFYHLKDVKTKP